MKYLRLPACFSAAVGLAIGLPAANRSLELLVPAKVAPGAQIRVRVLAATDAGAGEQIGFLHMEVSTDNGRNWSPLAYEQDLGASLDRGWSVAAGAAGTRVQVRVRVAFRSGVAGDVDHTGAAIRWRDTWEKWKEPPARLGTVAVGP